jgi:hypothetical protein
MKDFKGFDDWIEIFRGGKQTDSMGRNHDGDAIIEKAVASFDAARHEPPLVAGHPQDNAPAYGWVEGLETKVKDGAKVLLAKFKQVVPEFENLVKRGLYKKRSASFYPDGSLRHVGFLGAAPPAVKGLADIGFKDGDDAITFDFSDEGLNTVSRIFRKIREYLIEKEGADRADSIIPDWDVEYIRNLADRDPPEEQAVMAYGESNQHNRKQEGNKMAFKDRLKNMLSFMGVDTSKIPDDALPDMPPSGGEPSFTEADLAAAKRQAAEEARRDERKKADAEFAEKERTRATEARQGEIANWCEQMVKEGKMTPAWVKFGIPQILSFLASKDDIIEFGENKEKASPYDKLKTFFDTELPKVVEFGEIARRDGDVGAGGAGVKLSAIVRKKMSDNPNLSFSEAFKAAQVENPDLAQEYSSEISPK